MRALSDHEAGLEFVAYGGELRSGKVTTNERTVASTRGG
jgi:hypothetical protein